MFVMSDEDDFMPDPDDEQFIKDMERYQHLIEDHAEAVESAGRRCGLHVKSIGLSMAPLHEHDDVGNTTIGMQPVMVCNFAVGEAAWGDRVQNAEQYTVESEFRKLASQADRDKFEEMRAELQRRLEEGGDIWEGGDDEDDQS